MANSSLSACTETFCGMHVGIYAAKSDVKVSKRKEGWLRRRNVLVLSKTLFFNPEMKISARSYAIILISDFHYLKVFQQSFTYNSNLEYNGV